MLFTKGSTKFFAKQNHADTPWGKVKYISHSIGACAHVIIKFNYLKNHQFIIGTINKKQIAIQVVISALISK